MYMTADLAADAAAKGSKNKLVRREVICYTSNKNDIMCDIGIGECSRSEEKTRVDITACH